MDSALLVLQQHFEEQLEKDVAIVDDFQHHSSTPSRQRTPHHRATPGPPYPQTLIAQSGSQALAGNCIRRLLSAIVPL